MANKLICEMGLPRSTANIFAARNITTAKDALSQTELELMVFLDVGLAEVRSAIAHISEAASPPCQTALSLLEQRSQNDHLANYLPTGLRGLDAALCGGIPFGVLTELVGPPGIGKTQFCLKLSLLAALPTVYGGLDGHVVYVDVESKFSSKRMVEIGARSFPEVFPNREMARVMAGRIHVVRPTSLSEFTHSLEEIKVSVLQNQVKMLIVDSIAALIPSEFEKGRRKQYYLSWHISFIKSLAELSRIPIIVTNQVRSRSSDEAGRYSFQAQSKAAATEATIRYDSHLVAALGFHWAHSVTVRLILESKSGQRIIKVAKSPFSSPLAFPFHITSSGISLLSDDGTEVGGAEINTIHCQGQHGIITQA